MLYNEYQWIILEGPHSLTFHVRFYILSQFGYVCVMLDNTTGLPPWHLDLATALPSASANNVHRPRLCSGTWSWPTRGQFPSWEHQALRQGLDLLKYWWENYQPRKLQDLQKCSRKWSAIIIYLYQCASAVNVPSKAQGFELLLQLCSLFLFSWLGWFLFSWFLFSWLGWFLFSWFLFSWLGWFLFSWLGWLDQLLGFRLASMLPAMDHCGKLDRRSLLRMAHGALQHLHIIALAIGVCQDHM